MATTNKGLDQPALNATNWNTPLNANFAAIDNALGSTVTKSVTGVGATPVALSLSEYQNIAINFTGVLSNNVTYTIPSGVGGLWIITNSTSSGNFSLTIASAGGGTSVSVGRNIRRIVYSDGTNITFADNSVDAGVICLWSGSIATIPTGWALCDGTNGTPDLRDRFVVGAGSTYAVGATGGSATVTLSEANLPSHSHTFSGTTSSDGAHTHTFTVVNTSALTSGSVPGTLQGSATTNTTDSAGAHTHTFSGTTSSVGSGTSVENRPPYYALAYIMKL